MLISLLTDFGYSAYVGVMKGVILSINPEAKVVDLCHEIAPQDIRQAAFVLYTSYKYFPPDTIHVVVVDPGVGTSRNALIVVTEKARFVAPDNGVLGFVLEAEEFKAFRLNNPRYWLPHVSTTFHGRDIFAPVAAHLSKGVPPEEMGEPLEQITPLAFPQPRKKGNSIVGEVLFVDRFGNLITNIKGTDLPPGLPTVEIKGRSIRGLSNSYAEAEGLLALIGSSGYLEIAFKNGSAATELQAGTGCEVRVTAGIPSS